MELTDNLIQERFDSITDRNQYGLRVIFDYRISNLLPEYSKEEVKEFCKTSKKWNCSCYGGSVGTYYAITRKL